MQHSAPARNWVGDNGKIIEPLFADYFLSLHPMRCFQGRLFTVDGMVEDEAPLKKEIYEQVRYYATTSVAPVSYTHLDVYKRQLKKSMPFPIRPLKK